MRKLLERVAFEEDLLMGKHGLSSGRPETVIADATSPVGDSTVGRGFSCVTHGEAVTPPHRSSTSP
jgi:hypothetical protein